MYRAFFTSSYHPATLTGKVAAVLSKGVPSYGSGAGRDDIACEQGQLNEPYREGSNKNNTGKENNRYTDFSNSGR